MLGHRLRVRTVLLLTALIPTLAAGGLAAVVAEQSWSAHRISSSIAEEAQRMNELMEARTAVTDEMLTASVLLRADEMGVTADQLLELYGVDFVADLADARRRVDRSSVLHADAAFADALSDVVGQRDRMGAAENDLDEAVAAYSTLNAALDAEWLEAKSMLDATLADGAVPDVIERRADVMRRLHEVFGAAAERLGLAEQLVGSAAPAQLGDLIAADREVRTGIRAVRSLFGPLGLAAHHQLRSSSGTHRFEAAVDRLIDDLLKGRRSHLADDLPAYGATFVDGAEWFSDLIELVRASSVDLRREAAAQAADDVERFRSVLALLTVVVAASLGAGALLARTITRPLARITAVVGAVHDGTFDLPPVEQSGPRELAEVALAVNDMAATLGAVEARALELTASHPRREDQAPLPGRTGEALQRALDRLRSLAAVDGLTGLLNRTAAFDEIERALARGRRNSSSVMAMFVDLDGLKQINDTHGHAAGDEAIMRTADALRRACRKEEIVARLGGDEFLVVGQAGSSAAEVEALAARVRLEVERTELWRDGHRIPLRCSVGMVIADPMCTSVEMLVADADQAMYVAKTAGRHRTAL